MKMLTTTIARVLFGLPFAIFGIMHLFNADKMTAYVPIPGGAFWIYVTGAALLAAGISVISGKLVIAACYGLALLMFVFIVTEHIPGLMDPARMQMAMGGLLKDMSLMGASLLLAGIYHNENKTIHL